MSLKRLLVFLMLMPVFLFAGNDRLFQISPDYFKDDFLLEKDDKLAIVHEGLKSTSVMPELPLRAHTMYLRHKRGPKEFYWYVGQMDEEKFGKLHAFSIKDNQLKASEVIYTRFYGSKQFKAFQDEADIYFDKDYIYSSRIATLYFMKNGRWELLQETIRPSVISIDTTIENLQITSLTKRLKRKVSKIYPVKPGLYAFDFMAPGYLPYVDAISVRASEIAAIKPQMMVLATDSILSVETSVTLDSIAGAQTLESAEILFDRFTSETKTVLSLVDTIAFEKMYPAMKSAAELNVAADLPEYAAYAQLYSNRRDESRNVWRNNKLGMIGVLDKALRAKLDSLQNEPLSGTMVPEKIEPVFETIPESEEKRISAVRLTFGKDHDRFDVVWIGNAEGVVPDTLFAILDAATTVSAHLTLTNNKPVWIYNEGGLVGRHQYRYSALNLIIDDQTFVCQGEFKLPSYIAEQPEVKEWLDKKSVVDTASAAVVDTVTAVTADTAVVAIVVDTAAVSASSATVVDSTVTRDSTTVVDAAAVRDSTTVIDSAAVSTAAGGSDSIVADSSTVLTDSSAVTAADSISVVADTSVAPAVEEKVVRYEEEEEVEEDEDVLLSENPLPRILKDATRGSVALIDSGSFRYKGKVVSMSPFAIHTTEVTQQFYQETLERFKKSGLHKDRSSFVDPQKPVHNIAWEDARKFCKAIGGDLPTEAQWEFAGRADNNEGALWNLDSVPDAGVYAVYRENSYKQLKGTPGYGPQAVASKKPNEWGIYDMSGNVAEWTKDKYFMFSLIVESSNPTGAMMGSHKVYKGGSWKDKESYLNLTDRDDEDPRYWSNSIGFRCAFPRSAFEGK